MRAHMADVLVTLHSHRKAEGSEMLLNWAGGYERLEPEHLRSKADDTTRRYEWD